MTEERLKAIRKRYGWEEGQTAFMGGVIWELLSYIAELRRSKYGHA